MIKNGILFILTIGVGFACGVWMGQHPNELPQKLGIQDTAIRILISDTELLPADWQLWESKIRSKIDIRQVSSLDKFNDQTEGADLIFTSQEWLRLSRVKGERFDKYKKLEQKILKNVSVDFMTVQTQQEGWIPFWWEANENNLNIYSWVLHKTTEVRLQKALELLQLIIDKNTVLGWIDDTDMKTTFMSLDESFIPEEKKASYLRKNKFPTIKK